MSIENKKIIIDANFPSETRVVLLGNKNNIEDIKCETANKKQNIGNIYLARISRIEPSLQAVFIEYGSDKSGFLPFVEIHPDYYNSHPSHQKSFIKKWEEVNPPTITNDDLKEQHIELESIDIIDKDEIDIEEIKKLVEEKAEPEFELEAAENEIDTIEVEVKERERAERQPKIQDVLKKNQILLVQLTKEERGNKGASFTTYLSLAGKYCVLMPNKTSSYGISKKIVNGTERKRLKNIVSGLSEYTKTASVIARTAAMGHTTLEIKKDYEYLANLWNKIRHAVLQSSAPNFIHQEEDIIQKVIRDMCDRHVGELYIQGEAAYQKAFKFIQDIAPNDIKKLREYKDQIPIFTKFEVEEQLMKLYQPIVHLASGGYIVINPTEALISIDVNSGRSTSERNIEETALKTNLEAAKEIALQVKLRGLSGLIVIDFIDMQEIKNRKIVERSFKEFLSFDKAKIQTSMISNFGLLEMSRQRMGSSFLETNSSMCTHCNGKGLIRADESNAMLILRTVENEIFMGDDNVGIVNVYANSYAVIYLLNNKRVEIGLIEEKYKIKLNFHIDHNATTDSYSLEKVQATTKPVERVTDNVINSSLKADEENVKPQQKRKPNRYKKEKVEINELEKPEKIQEKDKPELNNEVQAEIIKSDQDEQPQQNIAQQVVEDKEEGYKALKASNKRRKFIYRKRPNKGTAVDNSKLEIIDSKEVKG